MSSVSEDLLDDLDDDEKVIIYSIGSNNNTPITSKVKLQKILFLISNLFQDFQEKFDFEPHLLGPYSENIDYITEDLVKLNVIEKIGSKFILTEKGVTIFNLMNPKQEIKDAIIDFKEFLNDLSDDEVLVFVYVSYPQFIAESARWDKLKKKRINIAVSLLEKEKVSFSKASEIAGISQIEFSKILKQRDINWRN